jgi:GTP-binding protein
MDADFSKSEIEKARKVFSGACDFILGVASLDQLPKSELEEVAFAGRSNVGKSSLLNALTGRKALARTSHTPGRTQQLNYFNLGDRLFLVDMPGYGFAKVSKSQKEEWNRLIRDYLRGRPSLRCVFILVDARHGLKPNDLEIMEMLDKSAVPYRIILTKKDKVKRQELEKTEGDIILKLKKHPAAFPEIWATSSHKGSNVDILRAIVLRQVSN